MEDSDLILTPNGSGMSTPTKARLLDERCPGAVKKVRENLI
jgi:hypothetical protein